MLEAIILGLIQGITEWLPVSSSGHLVIAQHLLGIKENLAMDVMLHIGTVCVVIFMFRSDIWKIILSCFKYIRTGKADKYAKLGLFLIIASIATGIIGLSLKDQIEAAFSSLTAVGIALIITGLVLSMSKYATKRKKMTWRDSLIIGLVQGAAVFPGISRSGSTISTGLLLGIDRNTAARFSFLLFIPASIGALLFQLDEFAASDYTQIAIATITAMVTSYFVIGYLLRIVKQGKLHWFSYYCWILGIIILLTQTI